MLTFLFFFCLYFVAGSVTAGYFNARVLWRYDKDDRGILAFIAVSWPLALFGLGFSTLAIRASTYFEPKKDEKPKGGMTMGVKL